MRRIGKSIFSLFLAGVMTFVPVGESFAAGNTGNGNEISLIVTETEENTGIEAPEPENASSESKEKSESENEAETENQDLEEGSDSREKEDESGSESKTETESETDTGNVSETDIETETESERQTETEIQTESETQTETEIQTESETQTETETQPETAKEDETEIETGTEVETETDTEEESTEGPAEAETSILPIERTELTEEERTKLIEELRAMAEAEGHVPSGYMDVDYEAEKLSGPVEKSDHSFAMASRSAALPRSYDARAAEAVSAVKNQGSWGTCWSFSAVATAESAYKRLYGSEANLSELQLVKFFYEGDNVTGPDGGLEGDKITALEKEPVQRGGNSYFTTFAMARWTGIADEATDTSLVYPYNTSSTNDLPSIEEQYAYADALHLKNAYWINIEDQNSIKKAIMDYGTVGVSYYQESIYSSDYFTYYMKTAGGDSTYQYDGPAVYYNPNNTSTNHAVAIVGWDDDFDRNNFQHTPAYASGSAGLPQQNGAWLIKNSWGTSVSDGGFFWISYEDLSLKAAKTVFAFDFDEADKYDHNYQYDGSAGLRSIGGTSLTTAAIYTTNGEAGSYQTISAVGIGFSSASTDYTIKIYTDLKNKSNPESGNLAATVTGKTSFEGFYTIELDKTILTEAGKDFGVVVTASKNGERASISVDMSYTNGNWIEFTANTENDRTFLKSGSSWKSTNSSSSSPYTVRIKAYTNDVSATPKARDRVIIDDMLEEIAPQTFNGTSVEPQVRVVFAGTVLEEGTDYEVAYENNDKISTSNAKAKAIIIGKGDYSGTVEKEFTITKKAIDADMILIPDGVFDGTSHKSLEVVYNGVVLTEGTDYTVGYSKNPVNAGKYTVTVKGKGNYSGSAKKNFTVDKMELTDGTVSLDYTSVNYSGKENKPAVTVRVGEYKVPASNYTVKYKDNKTVGTASVTITGKGNCQGSVTKQFTIEPKRIGSEEPNNITVIVKGGTYTGNEVKPAVTVKDGKTVLKLNKDYILTYSNNTNATTESSKASVTVVGTGNYSGTVEKQYEIAVQKVAAGKIKAAAMYGKDNVSVCTVTVNGKEIAPSDYVLIIKKAGTEETVNDTDLQPGEKYHIEVALKNNYAGGTTVKNVICKKAAQRLAVEFSEPEKVYTYTGSAIKPKITVKDGEAVLKTNKAYSVVYSDNINAGTATITVTGKGEYAGAVSIPFTIEKKDVSETLKISGIPNKTYTGQPIMPAVTVKNGKTSLKANKDYTCSYFNNLNVSYDENNTVIKEAKVVIRLSDNYTMNGSNTTETYFQIDPAKISKVTASSCYYKGEGIAIEPDVAVKAGKISVSSDDYIVTYSNNTKVNSKAGVTVEVKAGRNFTGRKSASFKITKEPLSKATVTGISGRVYSGNNITFDAVLKNSGQETIDPSDYTVTYSKNKNVGTGQVTFKANADSIYSGSATKKFKINKADLNTVISADSISAQLSAKTYTGGKQTYTGAEIKGIVNAVVQGDVPTYKVSYSNNVNAGTASLIMTGTGNYSGRVEIPFAIEPRSIGDVDITVLEQATYNNGNPVYATIKKIVYGKKKLKRSTDYTLSYINSTRRGIAAVQVTGSGNYTGTKIIYYVIE